VRRECELNGFLLMRRLIRQLLRTDDKNARRNLLMDAFKPKEKMYKPDGETIGLPDGCAYVQLPHTTRY